MELTYEARMSQVLSQIKEPQIPDLMVSVLDFGAQPEEAFPGLGPQPEGDSLNSGAQPRKASLNSGAQPRETFPGLGQPKGDSLGLGPQPDRTSRCQTAALQAAIDYAADRGGGTVVIPSGRFLTGSLELKSGVNLHLEQPDSVLAFTTEMTEEHYPVDLVHWEASPCMNYRSLIYARDAHDIALTGCGILDAQSDQTNWWSWHHQVENAWSKDLPDLQAPARSALRRMNQEGVPVSQRRFGNGYFLRPNFVQTLRCKRVLLEGVTLKNSPMWQLNPVMCEHLTVRGMTLSAHGPNSDGCDPESCRYVLIENCRFDTGDDCISLKSGRDRDGRLAALPCENVVIRSNLFADGHGGIALGSEMSGGIQNVYADQNLFQSPNLTYVLRFKTNAKRGGVIRNVFMNHSTASAVGGAAVHATMLYEDGRNGENLPVFENIEIENITAHGGDYGIFLEAFPEVPIRGLVLRNIEIDGAAVPLRAMNWENPVLEQVKLNGLCYPRPTEVRILGVPMAGQTVTAAWELLGGRNDQLDYHWSLSESPASSKAENTHRTKVASSSTSSVSTSTSFSNTPECTLQKGSEGKFLTLTVTDRATGFSASSIPYLVLDPDWGQDPDFRQNHGFVQKPVLNDGPNAAGIRLAFLRLITRQILPAPASIAGTDSFSTHLPITRMDMARLLTSFCITACPALTFSDLETRSRDAEIAAQVVGNQLMAADCALASATHTLDSAACLPQVYSFRPAGAITRQEMATIAMQSCGVSYKNASTTKPVCADADQVNQTYATNVSRALYFQFMTCDPENRFQPEQLLTWGEALLILDRVADFAGK